LSRTTNTNVNTMGTLTWIDCNVTVAHVLCQFGKDEYWANITHILLSDTPFADYTSMCGHRLNVTNAGYTLQTGVAATPFQCRLQCCRYTACIGYNYNEATRECRVY
jgi:hypothetical protein